MKCTCLSVLPTSYLLLYRILVAQHKSIALPKHSSYDRRYTEVFSKHKIHPNMESVKAKQKKPKSNQTKIPQILKLSYTENRNADGTSIQDRHMSHHNKSINQLQKASSGSKFVQITAQTAKLCGTHPSRSCIFFPIKTHNYLFINIYFICRTCFIFKERMEVITEYIRFLHTRVCLKSFRTSYCVY